MFELKIKKLHPNAILPTRATEKSSGYDMYAVEEPEIETIDVKLWKDIPLINSITDIEGGFIQVHKYKYKTGIAIQPPEGYDIKLHSRSSVHKSWSWLSNGVGVGDQDYTGEYMFIFYSFSDKPPFEIGDRIGQFILEQRNEFQIKEVGELTETKRGEGGFGSTGV